MFQEMPFKSLAEAAERVGSFIHSTVLDMNISDPVFPLDYLTAMKTGQFSKVPIMTGTVLNDVHYIPEVNDFGKNWNKTGPIYLHIKESHNKSEVTDEEILQANLIKQFYIGNGKQGLLNESLTEYVEMMTDAFYLSPDQKVAELASIYVPVYNYRLLSLLEI